MSADPDSPAINKQVHVYHGANVVVSEREYVLVILFLHVLFTLLQNHLASFQRTELSVTTAFLIPTKQSIHAESRLYYKLYNIHTETYPQWKSE